MVSIYALIDPTTNHIKYIGKAKTPKKRFSQHLTRARRTDSNTYCYHWIRSLFVKNTSPELLILDEVVESEWMFWEQHYISLYKSFGFKLTNHNGGGNLSSKEAIEKAKNTRRKNMKPRNPNETIIRKNARRVLVTNMGTGEQKEYPSLTTVCKLLSFKRAKLQEVLSEKYQRKSYKGYQLEYLS